MQLDAAVDKNGNGGTVRRFKSRNGKPWWSRRDEGALRVSLESEMRIRLATDGPSGVSAAISHEESKDLIRGRKILIWASMCGPAPTRHGASLKGTACLIHSRIDRVSQHRILL